MSLCSLWQTVAIKADQTTGRNINHSESKAIGKFILVGVQSVQEEIKKVTKIHLKHKMEGKQK